MGRGKLRVVQCDDEYMTEEHENTTHQDAESSDEVFTESDDEDDEDDHDDTADNAQGNVKIFSIDHK